MSHGSEDADPTYSPARIAFHQAAIEIIYQCRNGNPALRDLQNMRADARAALVAIEREIQVKTSIDLTRDERPRCTCYRSGRMNLAPASGHLHHCAWYRPDPDGPAAQRYCGPRCQARNGACTGCGDTIQAQVDALCLSCRDNVEGAHSWCPK